ncbi:MAG TPA: hypothetical protein VGF15_06240 [Solirubrobacteraceae bacterium]
MDTATPRTANRIFSSRLISLGVCGLVALTLTFACVTPTASYASGGKVAGGGGETSGGTQLETAAAKAGETGRKVAMSLIGLAFAIAAIVLAFRRDFKEAAGVLGIGILAVFLASAHGVTVLENTVNKLFA